MSVGGCGARGLLWLRGLAGAKGAAEEGPEEEAEARSHPKPAFWLSGL